MIRRFDKTGIPHNPELVFDWSRAGSLPVSLEIGCGDGEHALNYSLNHPEEFLIALERTTNKFQGFENKLQKLESPPPNLLALQADALHWCAHNLDQGPRLSRIFLLYPNPYPKEKQANLRFVNMPFMGFLLDHLKSGGTITMATNIRVHHEEALEKFQEIWGLEVVENRQISPSSEPRTAFERKYLDRGEGCYNLIVRKP